MKKVITGRIDKWEFVNGMIYGHIYGDIWSRFIDGKYIRTSPVTTGDDDIKENAIIETVNSVYQLGERMK